MNHLNQIVEDYLKKKTNHAILVTGKWGVGKTYYFKDTLFPQIAETVTLEDASQKYKPLHISLFGVKSLEDLQTHIFLSINPLLKNKVVKLSSGVFKSVVRGAMAIKNLGNLDDYIADVKPDAGDWITLGRLVICLDDLERKSSNLPLEELIGYVNSLVENEGVKVVFIANKDKIEDKKFQDFQEKVVGVTIEYLPDFDKNLKSIVGSRYQVSSPTYATFLEENFDLIKELSGGFEENLRTLIYALDNLHEVFSGIRKDYPDTANNREQILIKKLSYIVRLTISISVEYKKGEITYSNRNDLAKQSIFGWDQFDPSMLRISSTNQANDVEEPYRQRFLKTYFANVRDFVFLESIFAYATGATGFELNALEQDVREAYRVEAEGVPVHYKIWHDLGYDNFLNLSESEYRSLTREMVNYAEEGKYKIADYFSVFNLATRFDNLLNYDIDRLKARIIKGLRKGKTDFPYVPNLDMYLNVPQEVAFRDCLLEIRTATLAINRKIKEAFEKKERVEFLEKMTVDVDDFLEELSDSSSKWSYTPLFEFASAHKVYLMLRASSPKSLYFFMHMMKTRYQPQHVLLKKELDFVTALRAKLAPDSQARQRKTIKNHQLTAIHEVMTESIQLINIA